MKIYQSIVITCLFLISSFATASANDTLYNPSDTAIVFDVDDVILTRTVSVPALLWRHKIDTASILFDFSLMKDIITLYWMTAPIGAYISLFERKRPELIQSFISELATTRVLIPETVRIIETLLELGYQLHIGTNQTANEFMLHRERFPIFSRFATYTFADYSGFPNVMQKPDPRYFKSMKDRILSYNKETTNLIFIDDREDNVQAASASGYIGIRFTSPEALETSLIDLGILAERWSTNPLHPGVIL